MSDGAVARRYSIHGRVQGVGFRWFTRQVADEIGISGWVKNLPDGTVGAFARGTIDQIDRFEARIQEGPPAGRVERLDVEDVAPDSGTTGRFEIRH